MMNSIIGQVHWDARLDWWREARFGLFIHWGVYAVPAGFYQGRRIPNYAEWIMNTARIPCAEYRAFAAGFHAEAYDPAAWVRAARQAGMRYMVITAKHHDGFALFDTKVNGWNALQAAPCRRDLLRELVEACREAGMPLGFYYSQAQDWINGGSATNGLWDPEQGRDMDAYIDQVAIPQIRELLTNYGPDMPALLWWDTPTGMDEAKARRIEEAIQAVRPGLITNNRLYSGARGDILTPEQFIPQGGYPGRDWETCMTMNRTWGYASDDHDWKSSSEMIRNLADITSKGGNYLINIGPDAGGAIPQESLERMAEIGCWMEKNGEAIYGTVPVELAQPVDWGRCTARGRTVYAHILDWPRSGKILLPVAGQVAGARYLDTGVPVPWKDAEEGTWLELPERSPDSPVVAVAVEFQHPVPRMVLPLNVPGSQGAILLPAQNALALNRVSPRTAPRMVIGGKREAILMYWKSSDEAALWRVRVREEGNYRVRLHCSAAPHCAGTPYEISVEGRTLRAVLQPTQDWLDYQWRDAGTLQLPAGDALEVVLQPGPLAHPEGFLNLKALELVPEW